MKDFIWVLCVEPLCHGCGGVFCGREQLYDVRQTRENKHEEIDRRCRGGTPSDGKMRPDNHHTSDSHPLFCQRNRRQDYSRDTRRFNRCILEMLVLASLFPQSMIVPTENSLTLSQQPNICILRTPDWSKRLQSGLFNELFSAYAEYCHFLKFSLERQPIRRLQVIDPNPLFVIRECSSGESSMIAKVTDSNRQHKFDYSRHSNGYWDYPWSVPGQIIVIFIWGCWVHNKRDKLYRNMWMWDSFYKTPLVWRSNGLWSENPLQNFSVSIKCVTQRYSGKWRGEMNHSNEKEAEAGSLSTTSLDLVRKFGTE